MGNPEDLGRYRLKRLLGRGTLGEIWSADDLARPGEKVVVKIMHAADEELAMARNNFARDAHFASMLRHPHFVSVHDAGEAAGTSYMVMDHVEGQSLRKALADAQTTHAEKLDWVRQIASGLLALHEAGIVHRDLKPENIIIRPDRTACIVDLGIAKWLRLGSSHDLDAIEAPEPKPHSPYVPPETVSDGSYDELGDQWAWGVVAHEILTGALPGPDDAGLGARDDVPKALAEAIDRARSRDRTDRFVGMDLIVDGAVGREPRGSGPPATTTPPALAATSPDAPPAGEAGAAGSRSLVLVACGGALVLAVICAIVAALR